MLSPANLRTVQRIDIERRKLARWGIATASKVGNRALRHAAAAIRIGHDPIDAAKDVIEGNPDIHQSGIVPILADTMLAANLRGRRRSALQASRQGPQTLSRESEKRKREIELLGLLLFLDDDEIESIRDGYVKRAEKIVSSEANPLYDRMAESAKDIADVSSGNTEIEIYRGKVIPAYNRLIDGDFNASGFVSGNPYALERMFGTATVEGYEQGRFDAQQDDAIQSLLWGYHRIAVLDNRTTAICRAFDGIVAPKDDPFWENWRVPLHWYCRSVTVEVWKSSMLAEPEIIQPEISQEQMDRFIAFRDSYHANP